MRDTGNIFRDTVNFFENLSYEISHGGADVFAIVLQALFWFIPLYVIYKIVRIKNKLGFIVYFISKPMWWGFTGPWFVANVMGSSKEGMGAWYTFILVMTPTCLLLGFKGYVLSAIILGLLFTWLYNREHKEAMSYR